MLAGDAAIDVVASDRCGGGCRPGGACLWVREAGGGPACIALGLGTAQLLIWWGCPLPPQVANPASCLTLLVDKHLAAVAERKAALAEHDLTCLSSPGTLALLMAWEGPLQGLFRDLAGAGPASNRPSASELQAEHGGGGKGPPALKWAPSFGSSSRLARSPSAASLGQQGSSGSPLLVRAGAGRGLQCRGDWARACAVHAAGCCLVDPLWFACCLAATGQRWRRAQRSAGGPRVQLEPGRWRLWQPGRPADAWAARRCCCCCW
jgi:hypothetical protein